ncbi:hypothetical protein [Chamaesiphon sp. OTE_8_metabat_110]|uniref:hypothetical protein n=1 Tax=Chamaesiphon sp. OTE_8_metabat_110 TaxID=2964696 RepID=UPI00286AE760|nr:hypothetical protein [Chamaesiphon sp. OTE_8_metabat_110]
MRNDRRNRPCRKWESSKIKPRQSLFRQARSMDTTKILPILGATAFGLLVLVTLGIGYLTVLGWRDRQRREQDRRASR